MGGAPLLAVITRVVFVLLACSVLLARDVVLFARVVVLLACSILLAGVSILVLQPRFLRKEMRVVAQEATNYLFCVEGLAHFVQSHAIRRVDLVFAKQEHRQGRNAFHVLLMPPVMFCFATIAKGSMHVFRRHLKLGCFGLVVLVSHLGVVKRSFVLYLCFFMHAQSVLNSVSLSRQGEQHVYVNFHFL